MLFWNKVTALLTALLLLAGCSSDVGKAGTDDSLYRAIDRKNLAWVEEAAQGADLDHIYYRSANNTISALSAELTGEWSDASRGPTPIFRFLLEAGADVNAVHHSGRSPSFDAMGFSDEVSLPYMQLMLDYGMDLTAKDPDGNTLLDAALRSGNDKTALFLLESGAVPTENTLSMLFNGYTGERDGRCAYNVLRSLVADYDLNSPDIPRQSEPPFWGKRPMRKPPLCWTRRTGTGCSAALPPSANRRPWQISLLWRLTTPLPTLKVGVCGRSRRGTGTGPC